MGRNRRRRIPVRPLFRRRWAVKGKLPKKYRKQKGGFLGLMLAGLAPLALNLLRKI